MFIFTFFIIVFLFIWIGYYTDQARELRRYKQEYYKLRDEHNHKEG